MWGRNSAKFVASASAFIGYSTASTSRRLISITSWEIAPSYPLYFA